MKFVAILTAAVMLAGCATTGANYTPVVDMQGRDTATYALDLRDCQQYAATQPSAGDAAIGGAIIGALFGVALLAAGGGRGGWGNEMAGVGALAGGVQAANAAENGQRAIVSRCLAGRGWSVLQ